MAQQTLEENETTEREQQSTLGDLYQLVTAGTVGAVIGCSIGIFFSPLNAIGLGMLGGAGASIGRGEYTGINSKIGKDGMKITGLIGALTGLAISTLINTSASAEYQRRFEEKTTIAPFEVQEYSGVRVQMKKELSGNWYKDFVIQENGKYIPLEEAMQSRLETKTLETRELRAEQEKRREAINNYFNSREQ